MSWQNKFYCCYYFVAISFWWLFHFNLFILDKLGKLCVIDLQAFSIWADTFQIKKEQKQKYKQLLRVENFLFCLLYSKINWIVCCKQVCKMTTFVFMFFFFRVNSILFVAGCNDKIYWQNITNETKVDWMIDRCVNLMEP